MIAPLQLNRRRTPPVQAAALYAAAVVLIVLCVAPAVWMISTSFKPADEIFASPPLWVPAQPTLSGYLSALGKSDMAAAAVNSAVVATLTTLLALVLAIGAGYGFARFRFFGRDALAVSVLFSQLLPS